MPSRIILTNYPDSSGKPVLQEQRLQWFFDASKCTKVLPSSSQYRTAGGTVEARPSLWDGSMAVSASFQGASYQFLYVVFSSPIDWVQVTARNDARTAGCSMTFAGAAVVPDVVPLFGPVAATKEWKVQRGAGTLAFNTGAAGGAFRFMEILGWAEL